jgi:hypothetical protein
MKERKKIYGADYTKLTDLSEYLKFDIHPLYVALKGKEGNMVIRNPKLVSLTDNETISLKVLGPGSDG